MHIQIDIYIYIFWGWRGFLVSAGRVHKAEDLKLRCRHQGPWAAFPVYGAQDSRLRVQGLEFISGIVRPANKVCVALSSIA